MVSSRPSTVAEYLASLPPDRRKTISAVRALIRKHLPRGYEEGMQYGMIGYYVPLAQKPDTYNGQPITLAALAAQKSYTSLYLMNVYSEPDALRWFREAFRKAGKKLDMGKSCVRFKTLDDLPLDVIGRAIARTSVQDLVAQHDAAHRGRQRRQPTTKAKARAAAKR